MRIFGRGLSDIGRTRKLNEDAFHLDDDLGLYVVCDGLGGHAHGEVASRLATETVQRYVRERHGELQKHPGDRDLMNRIATGAAHAASTAVYTQATRQPEHAGMACTLTFVLVSGSKAVMGHVGDTRLYLWREGAVELLSTDHTHAYLRMMQGELTPAEARTSRQANVLTRAIGSQESVEVDTLFFDLLPDDQLLLCSDGLTRHVTDLAELSALLTVDDLPSIPATLIELANQRGGEDNITALVLRAQASPGEQAGHLNVDREAQRKIEVLRSVDLFQDLRFSHLLRVVNRSHMAKYTRDETVLSAGSLCQSLYVVLSGDFCVESGNKTLRQLARGDYVGESTLLEPRPARACLRACSRGVLLAIPGAEMLALSRRRHWFGVSFLGRLAQVLSRDAPERQAV